MKFLLRVMDFLMFNFLWIGHVMYNRIVSIVKRSDDIREENRGQVQSTDDANYKRHFIHLYTTSGNNRRVCYMDVYEISSPMDEKKLRQATSKGFPNKTYFRYNQSKLSNNNGNSQTWLEYSTLAL